jgi:hypothetical protein
MEKFYSEPKQARNREQRIPPKEYPRQLAISWPYNKEWTSLDELFVNRANKEAKIFRA